MLLWILIGVVLLVLEILSSTFFILFFGLGALSIAGLLFFTPFALHYQVAGFAFLSFLYLVLFRKLLKFKKQKNSYEVSHDLIGEMATVYEDIAPYQEGKVLVGDTFWKATSLAQIHKGTKVKIIGQNNLTLEVKPL
jgi:membrane protein implicated in regulation of membrane protease activity